MITIIVEPPLHEGKQPESWRVLRNIYVIEVEFAGQLVRFFTPFDVREGFNPNTYEIDVVEGLEELASRVLEEKNFKVIGSYPQQSQN